MEAEEGAEAAGATKRRRPRGGEGKRGEVKDIFGIIKIKDNILKNEKKCFFIFHKITLYIILTTLKTTLVLQVLRTLYMHTTIINSHTKDSG